MSPTIPIYLNNFLGINTGNYYRKRHDLFPKKIGASG